MRKRRVESDIVSGMNWPFTQLVIGAVKNAVVSGRSMKARKTLSPVNAESPAEADVSNVPTTCCDSAIFWFCSGHHEPENIVQR